MRIQKFVSLGVTSVLRLPTRLRAIAVNVYEFLNPVLNEEDEKLVKKIRAQTQFKQY